jgi:hypothetical protein
VLGLLCLVPVVYVCVPGLFRALPSSEIWSYVVGRRLCERIVQALLILGPPATFLLASVLSLHESRLPRPVAIGPRIRIGVASVVAGSGVCLAVLFWHYRVPFAPPDQQVVLVELLLALAFLIVLLRERGAATLAVAGSLLALSAHLSVDLRRWWRGIGVEEGAYPAALLIILGLGISNLIRPPAARTDAG